MKKLAKLYFTPIEGKEFKTKSTEIWYTVTQDVAPNDWSIRLQKITLVLNNEYEATAEIDFMMPTAEYLLKIGTKFKIFSRPNPFECEVEVIADL